MGASVAQFASSPALAGGDRQRPRAAGRSEKEARSYAAELLVHGSLRKRCGDWEFQIWGEYAIDLYNSLGESFEELPTDHEVAFGQSGILAGGQTLDQVKRDLIGFSIPRPEHWPYPAAQGAGDGERLQGTGEVASGPKVFFSLLLDEGEAWKRIQDRVLNRVRDWEENLISLGLVGAISDLTTALKHIS